MIRRLGVVIAPLLFALACTGGLPPASRSAPDGASELPLEMYQGSPGVRRDVTALSQVVGRGKPVVLNFWAGQCPPCRAEMPDFEKVHQQYRDQVLVLGIDVGPFIGLGSREDGKALLRQLNITYAAATTSGSSVVQAFEILGMPTTLFYTSDGRLHKRHSGILTGAQIDTLVQELLAAS